MRDAGIEAIVLCMDLRSGKISPDQAQGYMQALLQIPMDEAAAEEVRFLGEQIVLERRRLALWAKLQGARSAHFVGRRGMEVMVHPAVRPDAPTGAWQVTRFGRGPNGELQPWGHHNVRDFAGAIREAWDEHGPLELVQRANPSGDERLRRLQRAAAEGDEEARMDLLRLSLIHI